MPNQHEEITFAPDASFRLLRWIHSVSRVSVIRGGRAKPVRGQGDHWHYHRAMELTLIEHGSGTRFVADHIERFDAGDLVLIGSGVPHYWHSRARSAGLSVQWDFPVEHGIWSFGEATVPLQALAARALHGLQLSGESAKRIAAAMGGLATLDGLAGLAGFLQLLGELTSAPARDLRPLATRPFSLDGTAEQQESMRRAVSYILASYRNEVRLDDLLRLSGTSRATFARQFKRHSGKSFCTFLNQVRLQAVCRALAETNDAIGAIAFSHGFNQLSFFNRLFRRELGTSPRRYRMDHAGGLPAEGSR